MAADWLAPFRADDPDWTTPTDPEPETPSCWYCGGMTSHCGECGACETSEHAATCSQHPAQASDEGVWW